MAERGGGASRTIRVDLLARVEGEGALTIRTRRGVVEHVELRIFEPPRFFESLLRGRKASEPPDITSRICGICPVAYQMSACNALEDALGMEVTDEIRELRRLLYFAEWIESHTLHMFLLHLPDFLGYPDALRMAEQHGDRVRAALRMKKAGNTLLRVIGGREIHPVNVRVGGFYRAPARGELEALLPELRWGRDAMREALGWLAGLDYPELERDWELVALREQGEYAILGGRIASSAGLDLDVREYDEHFVEHQVPHSNALHATIRGRGAYLCGPLARFNLSFEQLSPAAREAAREARIEPPCRNPFKSLLVRGVEVVHAFDESIRAIDRYVPPSPSFVEMPVRAGTGHGATEAPRGLLHHRYRLDEHGLVADAKIVPPTSQNQRSIEEDLRRVAERLIALPRAEATLLAERTVRNHDPCISCATHFLKLEIEEAGEG